MSRRWFRAPTDMLCGRCQHRFIVQGEAVLGITIPGVKRERIRCQDCAGAAPPDLPPLPTHPKIRTTKKLKPMTSQQMMATVLRYRSPHNSD